MQILEELVAKEEEEKLARTARCEAEKADAQYIRDIMINRKTKRGRVRNYLLLSMILSPLIIQYRCSSYLIR